MCQQIVHLPLDQDADDRPLEEVAVEPGRLPADTFRPFPPERHVGQFVERQQAVAERVVKVVCVIGQAVGRIDDAGLERRLADREQLPRGWVILPLAVKDHRLTDLPR